MLFLSQTNTFQGIVVTDFAESYAVYIYKCQDMQFSGSASIGFTSRDNKLFASHRLSGYNARNIGCINSGQSNWVNQVYKMTREDLQPIQTTGMLIAFLSRILCTCETFPSAQFETVNDKTTLFFFIMQTFMMNVHLAYITVNRSASIYPLTMSVPATTAMLCRETESTASPTAMQTSRQRSENSTHQAGLTTIHRASTASGNSTSQKVWTTQAILSFSELIPLRTGWRATVRRNTYSSLMDCRSMRRRWVNSVVQLPPGLLRLQGWKQELCL